MGKVCIPCGSRFGLDAMFCPHDGSRLELEQDELFDPLLGTMLLQQFRIDEVIGSGGMGTVYRARQVTVGRDVAIKVLRSDLAENEEAVVRFQREARLATSIDHPNVVRVLLSGQLDDGRVYMVMELLEGRTLSDELDEQHSLDVKRTLNVLMKLCAGLGAVHAAGIVHRDIKPENVFLVQRGSDPDFVKVVDFGIARAVEDTWGTSGQAGVVLGTAAYISPEAATGDEVDDRSDIYSLGVLAYQMLTGELPFDADTPSAMLMAHVHDPAPHIQACKGGEHVPPEVAQVVMQALSKEADERPQTLAAFVEALAQAGAQAGLLADAPGLLLGTVWGDELTQQHGNLADLLGLHSPSSPPPDFGPRDSNELLSLSAEEEELLSEAPDPFDARPSYASLPDARHRRQGLLWLGFALVIFGITAVLGQSALFETAELAANVSQSLDEVPADAEPVEPFPAAAVLASAEQLAEHPEPAAANTFPPSVPAAPPEGPSSASSEAREDPAPAKTEPAPKKTAAAKPAPRPKKKPASAPKKRSTSAAKRAAKTTPTASAKPPVPATPTVAEPSSAEETAYPEALLNPWPATMAEPNVASDEAAEAPPAEPVEATDEAPAQATEVTDEAPAEPVGAPDEAPADPVADPEDDAIDWTAPSAPETKPQERPSNPVVIDEPPSESQAVELPQGEATPVEPGEDVPSLDYAEEAPTPKGEPEEAEAEQAEPAEEAATDEPETSEEPESSDERSGADPSAVPEEAETSEETP